MGIAALLSRGCAYQLDASWQALGVFPKVAPSCEGFLAWGLIWLWEYQWEWGLGLGLAWLGLAGRGLDLLVRGFGRELEDLW